jgi:hypothetical protein
VKANVYKPRDFDAEAKGKTRCALYGAAVQGLGPAFGMILNYAESSTIDEAKLAAFIDVCKRVAEEGVKYSFEGK